MVEKDTMNQMSDLEASSSSELGNRFFGVGVAREFKLVLAEPRYLSLVVVSGVWPRIAGHISIMMYQVEFDG